MAQALKVDERACTECRACELRCSFVHYGVFNSNKSGIRVFARWPSLPQVTVCRQCVEPDCLEACPTGALLQNALGVVTVVRDECTACGACVDACRYGSIWLDALSGAAVKCDTCNGTYECVSGCMVGALSYGE